MTFLPYIFGFVSLLSGLFILLISFRIYNPKRTEEQAAKFESTQNKYGVLIKLLSIILIVNGAYNVFNPDPSRFQINTLTPIQTWSTEDIVELKRRCMTTALKNNNDSLTASDYCDCTTLKITTAMTVKEFNSYDKADKETISKKLLPIIQECIDQSVKKTQ